LIILIGGTSHTGKSTLAHCLAARLVGTTQSTDRLARHPGRPWAPPPHAVRPHVVEHYRDLTDEERMASVLAHYRAMRPLIADVLHAHREGPATAALVVEGSALLPESAAALAAADVRAIWLTADDALLRTRIEAESGYARADPASRRLIEAFLERARRFDRFLRGEVGRRGWPAVQVEVGVSPQALADRCLTLMQPPP
jgi:2-phosphoglycerate kinase